MAAPAAHRARSLDDLRPSLSNRLEIRSDPIKGRGIFACEPIPAGTLIEAVPVIIVPAEQCPLLDRTILHDYYFHWDGDPDGDGRGAVALGLVALDTLDLVALSPIAAGDEVTIDYNCPLWFQPQD